jgi:hypothetical protein
VSDQKTSGLTRAIDILQRHAKFLVQCTSSEQGEFEADVTAALDTSTVRDMLSLLNSRCAGDLEGSSRVWGIWRDWEMSQLGDETERWARPPYVTLTGRAAQIERLHELFLGRLATPHLGRSRTRNLAHKQITRLPLVNTLPFAPSTLRKITKLAWWRLHQLYRVLKPNLPRSDMDELDKTLRNSL